MNSTKSIETQPAGNRGKENMTVLITCDGYKAIREVPDDADLPKLCREEEGRSNYGFAVLASKDGRLIADADGMWDRTEMDRPDPFDLACERRFD